MAFHAHERYQAFCRWCYTLAEADSAAEAVRTIEEHERVCAARKPEAEVVTEAAHG